ncbi:flagellar hook-associated protein 2 [Paenibacillus sp. cl141a]|uniref:flagellar filament capping protein FliD n=1 Tax=Paenibacillus sp. cl141a TaxID=1761877 RepID=UPI0008B897BC|nr:flagellar filament capping protein FliD [Paenibacillus sp. cl141a]SEL32344.1 flagellar hook-associated protein 2 [Paenibacillus sp. cl141a]
MSNISSLYNPIRYTGLSSGMDIDSIVKNLMQVERLPLQKLTRQKTSLIWQREDYRSMNTALTSFRKAAEGLRFGSSFETKQVVSSNPNAVDVTGSSGASEGFNTIKVLNLATSASLTGKALAADTKTDAVVSTGGDITIKGPKGTSTTISITSGSSSIDSIIKDINAQTTVTGVKANYDTNTKRLFLTTDVTGAKSEITVTDNSNAFKSIFNMDSLTSNGVNAKFEFNDAVGVNALESETNNFTLNGLTINLKSPTTEPVSVTVSKSNEVAFDKIKEFVNQYNTIVDQFYSVTSTKQDRSYQPLLEEEKSQMTDKQIEQWETKARQGSLYNDSTLKGALDDFRVAFREPLEGSTFKFLSDIGIKVMSDPRQNGKLEIDEEKLKKALTTNPDAVKDLFTKPSSTVGDTPENKKQRLSELGFAERLYESINNQINKINKRIGMGSVESIDDSILGKDLKRINDRVADLQRRLTDIENRHYKKFTMMEQALQKLNNQGSWLSSQLSSL